MPKLKTPVRSAALVRLTDLVEKSLDLHRRVLGEPKVDDYIHGSRLFLLEQWLNQEPELLAFSDGSSVMVRLFHISPELGIQWWQRRGEGAWSATPGHPHPLVSVLQSLRNTRSKPDNSVRYQWPKDMSVGREVVQAFVKEGMRLAMPLKTTDPSIGPKTNRSQDKRGEQFSVSEFATEDCSLFSAHEKTSWLLDNNGALCIARHAFGSLLNHPRITPSTEVWNTDYDLKFTKGTILDTWLASTGYPMEKEVLPWLAKHGVNVLPYQQGVMVNQVRNAHEWEKVLETTLNTPGGWEYQKEDQAVLLWQSCLIKNPRFLDDMFSMPEAALHLKSKSLDGLGVWSALMQGVDATREDAGPSDWPSLPSVLELDRRVPLEVGLSQGEIPLLFRLRNTLPAWWERFHHASVEKSMSAWVGEPNDQQAEMASSLLHQLLVGQVTNARQRENAALHVRLMHKLWAEHPEAFSPATVGVLWAIQTYLLQTKLALKEDLSLFLADSIPTPTSEGLGWVEVAAERVTRPDKVHPTLRVFHSVLKNARLQALPEAPSQRQKMRM